MKRTAFTVLAVGLVSLAFGQADSTVHADTTHKPKSYFSAAVSYLSNSVYNGRKDSAATPYITPTIGYYHSSGLFVTGSMSYLAKSGSSRIDVFNVDAGYDFYAGSFDGEVVAGKSFYNSQSTNVASQISGTLGFSGGYDFNFIKPTVEAGINFGSKADYLLGFGLEHTFYAAHDKWQFTPTASANGSTQNYYGSYYNKRKVGGKRKNAGVVYDVTATVEDASKFKMLAYQFSMPVLYVCHKFSFVFTPVYAVAVNPALITVVRKPENGGNTVTRTATESISNTFFWSVGATYKF